MRNQKRLGTGDSRAGLRQRAQYEASGLHADESRVPPPAVPLVWLLALLWLVLQTTGHGLGLLHDGYERGAAAAGGACLRVAKETLRLLGPLGRALRPLLTHALRGLLHVWNSIGVRVLLFLAGPLGEVGNWLLARTRPVLDRVVEWARRVALSAEPVLRALDAGARGVERAAGSIRELLRRRGEPVARAVRAMKSVLFARRSA
jgi:hypothetical protein